MEEFHFKNIDNIRLMKREFAKVCVIGPHKYIYCVFSQINSNAFYQCIILSK